MGERGAKGERIWPKLTRPEIKNEQKEKALRFRRGGTKGEREGDRVRDRHRVAPHGASEEGRTVGGGRESRVENGVRYGSLRRARTADEGQIARQG